MSSVASKQKRNARDARQPFTAPLRVSKRIGRRTRSKGAFLPDLPVRGVSRLLMNRIPNVWFLIPSIFVQVDVRWVSLVLPVAVTRALRATTSTGRRRMARLSVAPNWCFSGSHTIKLIKGNRRVFQACVEVIPDDSNDNARMVQQQIDDIDEKHTQVLNIHPNKPNPFWNLVNPPPNLNRQLCALQQLTINHIGMTNLVLTEDTTPNLEVLSIRTSEQGKGGHWDIRLSNLTMFALDVYPGDDYSWVLPMLELATKLESFECDRLELSQLAFYSNALKYVSLC